MTLIPIITHNSLAGYEAARHFLVGDIDHASIKNVGSKSHAEIDSALDSLELDSFVPYDGATSNLTLGEFNVTAANLAIADWNDAHGWGDHAAAGYALANAIITDHAGLSNIGVNTHDDIDSHISQSTVHFIQSEIYHSNLKEIGVNAHSVIDTHIDSSPLIHFTEASLNLSQYVPFSGAAQDLNLTGQGLIVDEVNAHTIQNAGDIKLYNSTEGIYIQLSSITGATEFYNGASQRFVFSDLSKDLFSLESLKAYFYIPIQTTGRVYTPEIYSADELLISGQGGYGQIKFEDALGNVEHIVGGNTTMTVTPSSINLSSAEPVFSLIIPDTEIVEHKLDASGYSIESLNNGNLVSWDQFGDATLGGALLGEDLNIHIGRATAHTNALSVTGSDTNSSSFALINLTSGSFLQNTLSSIGNKTYQYNFSDTYGSLTSDVYRRGSFGLDTAGPGGISIYAASAATTATIRFVRNGTKVMELGKDYANINVDLEVTGSVKIGTEIDIYHDDTNAHIDVDVGDLLINTAVTTTGLITGKQCGVYAHVDQDNVLYPFPNTVATSGTFQYIDAVFQNDTIAGFSTVLDVNGPAIQYDLALPQHFELDWHATICTDGTAKTVAIGVKVNNALLSHSKMGTFLKVSDERANVSGTVVLELSQNDKVQLVFTADATTVEFHNFQVTISEFFH